MVIGAVVVAILLLAAGAVGCAFTLTAGPVKAANAFFAVAAQRGPVAAYALASPAFRSSATPAQWREYARSRGLAGYTGASWASRLVENGSARLQGSLKLAGGGAVPATVQLSHGAAGWQVLRVDLASGGVTGAQSEDTQRGGSAGAAARLVPGAMVARLCKAALAKTTWARLETIECLEDLPTTRGAVTVCRGRMGAAVYAVRTTLTSYDPATSHFEVDCRVAPTPVG